MPNLVFSVLAILALTGCSDNGMHNTRTLTTGFLYECADRPAVIIKSEENGNVMLTITCRKKVN